MQLWRETRILHLFFRSMKQKLFNIYALMKTNSYPFILLIIFIVLDDICLVTFIEHGIFWSWWRRFYVRSKTSNKRVLFKLFVNGLNLIREFKLLLYYLVYIYRITLLILQLLLNS